MPVRAVTFAPDDKTLYSASDDGRVNVYDMCVCGACCCSAVVLLLLCVFLL